MSSISPEITSQHRNQLEKLCRKFAVEALYLFGSATTDDLDEESDLDFLVRFEPAQPKIRADRYFGLLAALRELFGKEIDLVEDGAVDNPYLLQSIQSSRQLIYEAA
ncbi:MAG: nucleotidyltransferase domain-containing protein [Thermoanaerobaculia bacterium]|nr:nucleotidyltransferase domain-containing protein [Thermoanaerobaculia bacterium]